MPTGIFQASIEEVGWSQLAWADRVVQASCINYANYTQNVEQKFNLTKIASNSYYHHH